LEKKNLSDLFIEFEDHEKFEKRYFDNKAKDTKVTISVISK